MKVAALKGSVELPTYNVEISDKIVESSHAGVILEECGMLRIPKIHRLVPPLPPLFTIILHTLTVSGAVIVDAMLIF